MDISCPFLIYVILVRGHHSHPSMYEQDGYIVPHLVTNSFISSIPLHVFTNTTLKNILSRIQMINKEIRIYDSNYSIALVFPDRTGHASMKKVALLHSTKTSIDDTLTMNELKVQAGDFLEIALITPK